MSETILVLDFGGQYNQLIARRVREMQVYSLVRPCTMTLEEIKSLAPKGIILTGGPDSVYVEGAALCSGELFRLDIPVLGICYGSQLMAHVLGGKVARGEVREYGRTRLAITAPSKLLANVPPEFDCWMSHTDRIFSLPAGFAVTAATEGCPIAAYEDARRGLYAVQFHPEVMHTEHGNEILRNFVYDVCRCSGDWKMSSFVEESVAALKKRIGTGRALLALSGGVDSSVAAMLLSRAIGEQLTCVFVDHGLLRKNESEEVAAVFGQGNVNFIRVDASERFYAKLAGITEPERKRKIIGEEFIRVFEEEAKKIGRVDYLVQGTIYPDVIESGLGKAAVIKSHHNVGGLPDYVDFREIVEPLRMLFKDEVRAVGRELGLPPALVNRQPFPGPGLAIRIIGEVTAEKVKLVQEADAIYREEIDGANLPHKPAQYFAALTNMRSVGVMGDERTYDYAVVLRAVETSDFMTADCTQLPWPLLERITNRIVGEVKGISRVLYDCTSKPPATIEME